MAQIEGVVWQSLASLHLICLVHWYAHTKGATAVRGSAISVGPTARGGQHCLPISRAERPPLSHSGADVHQCSWLVRCNDCSDYIHNPIWYRIHRGANTYKLIHTCPICTSLTYLRQPYTYVLKLCMCVWPHSPFTVGGCTTEGGCCY